MIESFNVSYTKVDELIGARTRVGSCPSDQILIQVFSGWQDQQKVDQFLREIRELFPGVALIGTSTAGEIKDAESVDNTLLVNFSLFEQTKVKSAIAYQNDDLTAAGSQIANDLNDPETRLVILFGCGLKDGHTINGEPLLDAVRAGYEDVVIAGGQAGDNGKGEITFVFTEDGVTENGVAAASLSGGRIKVDTTYNLSWVPIGKKLTITKAHGSRVYSIDDQSPYDIYVHYLGQKVADGLPLSAADFPLIIERDGIPMAIHATGVNDDGSFDYIHNFYPGEQLRFGFCHAGLLAVGAQVTHEEILRFQPEALFIYSCVSRKWILGADIAVELSSLSNLAPSAGFFCYGEYFLHENGKPYFFSQTMTVLSLTETDNEAAEVAKSGSYCPEEEESKQFRTMRVLHRLVDKSTREIEVMNTELAKLASKDSLTGLANRRLFDESLTAEIKRQSRSKAPLSLLLIDLDYFKQYNDIYGHVSGDDCLRAVSHVFDQAMKRPSDLAARYGGEEFSCLLPSTDFDGALHVAEEIRQEVEKLAILHGGADISGKVTVSIGVLTVADVENKTPEHLLEQCDRQLYAAKQNGRNRVVGEFISKRNY